MPVFVSAPKVVSDPKRERLNGALRRIERRWGPQTIGPASAAPSVSQGLATGFAALDQILGPTGVPLQAITLLSGSTTCGKLTLAYKILAQAQHTLADRGHSIAILDLGASADADYLDRCGIDLNAALVVRPSSGQAAVRVLLDLVCRGGVTPPFLPVTPPSRSQGGATPPLQRAILVDGVPDLMVDANTARAFDQIMPQVNLALKGTGSALIMLDEVQPPWLPALAGWTSRAMAHYAALHIELVREGWLESGGELVGYRAQARIVKRRGPGHGRSAPIAIEFGETVRARETW
ncbi:MAG: hypothetical protein HY782_21810 [Chloroflexi bacterium]|nr:hypothetical protein [Chloroflexota bacterium]